MSVGVAALDQDHQILVERINRGHSIVRPIVRQGEDIETRFDILNELSEYSENHFQREENYMAANDYLRLESHVMVHRELSAKVANLVSEGATSRNPAVASDILTLLENWLPNHIMAWTWTWAWTMAPSRPR